MQLKIILMGISKKTDVKDEILSYLKEIDRPLAYLSDKADIPYSSVYSIFRQKTFALSQENLDKINAALNTEFTFNK